MPGGLELVEATKDGVPCFTLAGEMDVSSAPRLPVRVRDALRRGARAVCIDLTGVTFIDSTGLAALLHCQRTVARCDARLAVVAAEGQVQRVLALTRIEQALALHPSRDAALAELRACGAPANGAGPIGSSGYQSRGAGTV